MNSRAKTTMVVMAFVFMGLAIISFGITIYYTCLSYHEIYKSTANIGSVILGIFYWFPVVAYGFMTAFFAGGILPFDLIARNRFKVRTWYTQMLFIFAITIIILSFVMILSLPLVNSMIHAARQAARSSSSSI